MNNIIDGIINRAKTSATSFTDCLGDIGCTAAGVVATVAAIATSVIPGIKPEVSSEIYKWANMTPYSRLIGVSLFRATLSVINPNFKGQAARLGWTSSLIAKPIFKEAANQAASKSFLNKHIVSRALCITGIAASAATRTADFALGLIGGSLSILTLGTIKPFNKMALSNLTCFGLVNDICMGLRAVVNPQLVLPRKQPTQTIA
jgi:hypothetical protein